MLHRRSPAADRATVTPRGPCDEPDLLARVAARDLRAFEALYRAYYPKLTRFIRSVVHRHHLVEEVLNDTMLVVWTRPQGYDGSSRVSTWIFGIAYKKALKALSRCDEPVSDDHLPQRMSLEPGPEQQTGDRQVHDVLVGAMGALSGDHRAVVDLVYFHGFDYREIAEIVGCPVDTVKTRMFHARRHLKRSLAGRLSDWL
jgi:RNA polymerase sigma-70 factor (ECF subfamily)